jgi:hypothetical protein
MEAGCRQACACQGPLVMSQLSWWSKFCRAFKGRKCEFPLNNYSIGEYIGTRDSFILSGTELDELC